MSHARLIRVAALALPVLIASASAIADNVLPGYDLFVTAPPTYQDFIGPAAIPPSFFDPGSDPFVGRIDFQGDPLPPITLPGCTASNLQPTDTIVRRPLGATLPLVGSTDVVPIELIQLSLVSATPITVTYSGGCCAEQWNVRVGLSPIVTSTGTMTIHHSLPSGGTFDSQLRVYPLLTFRRISDGAIRVLDGGAVGFADQFASNGVPWSHTSNSAPGCPTCGGNFYTGPGTEQAQLAAHGVIPLCPPAPTAVGRNTWGRIKTIYR